ncbi:hypothetical protein HYU13_03620 [Candidatus Woesearchaeota archaeon]|nr:hypothetical protein [Candidatus Woesearchaeota archaeon]
MRAQRIAKKIIGKVAFAHDATSEEDEFGTLVSKAFDPQELIQRLDIRDILWLYSHSSDFDAADKVLNLFCRQYGMNQRLLENANFFAGMQVSRFDERHPALAISNYRLLSLSHSPINTPPFFGALTHNGLTRKLALEDWSAIYVSPYLDRVFFGYISTPGNGECSHDLERDQFYLDAPVGLMVSYRGIPNALNGFFTSDPDTLMITQLQGLMPRKIIGGKLQGKHHSRGFYKIDMIAALVEMNMGIAMEAGFSRIGIRSGENNRWTKPDENGKIHLKLEDALKRYDGTAEKLGFLRGHDRNWYKDLPPSPTE